MVQIIECGDESVVRARLRAFVDEMDDLGVAYGHAPADLDDDAQIADTGGFLWDVPEDTELQAILVVRGEALVSGADGIDRLLASGQCAIWQPGEPRSLSVVSAPMHYFEVDGEMLGIHHLELGA